MPIFLPLPLRTAWDRHPLNMREEFFSCKNFLLFAFRLLIRNYFLYSPNTFTLDYRSSSENLRPRGECFGNTEGAENGFPEIPAGLINGFLSAPAATHKQTFLSLTESFYLFVVSSISASCAKFLRKSCFLYTGVKLCSSNVSQTNHSLRNTVSLYSG